MAEGDLWWLNSLLGGWMVHYGDVTSTSPSPFNPISTSLLLMTVSAALFWSSQSSERVGEIGTKSLLRLSCFTMKFCSSSQAIFSSYLRRGTVIYCYGRRKRVMTPPVRYLVILEPSLSGLELLEDAKSHYSLCYRKPPKVSAGVSGLSSPGQIVD